MWRYIGIQIIDFWTEGPSWYKLYSNGWCEQGGTVAWTASSANKTQVVTLHKPLQIDYNLLITAASNGYSVDNGHIVNEDQSVRRITSFGLTVSDPNGATKDSYNTWSAMGFLSFERERYFKYTESTTFKFEKGISYRITLVGGQGGNTGYKWGYGTNYANTLGGFGGIVTFIATFNKTMLTSIEVGVNGVNGAYDEAAWSPQPYVGTPGTSSSVIGISAVGGRSTKAPSTPGIIYQPGQAPGGANASGGTAANPNVINPISDVTVSVEVNGTAPNGSTPFCEITVLS